MIYKAWVYNAKSPEKNEEIATPKINEQRE
jgi:hypothetical protein